MTQGGEDAEDAGDGQAQAAPIFTQPKTVALIFAVFLLVIGLPAGLYLWAGQTRVAIGLIVLFALMVAASAYALRIAVQEHREEDPR